MTVPRNNIKTIARRELLTRELLASMLLMIILLGLALAIPADYGLTEHEDPSLQTIKGPWLILWLQFLLRYLPPVVAAILIPLALFIVIAALPWLPGAGKHQPLQSYRFGVHQAILLFVTVALAWLTFLDL
ncbi:MAG: hypothetical protein AAGU11_05235 [Syntrophobacteraceae bacterium]